MILKGDKMKMLKIILTTMFFIAQLQVAFAIKKPNVIRPSADSVSLRPLFVLSPVKNAASYEYKLKSVDPNSGATVTVETNTVSSNEFRITATLTAGTHYKMVLRAIDGSNNKSAKKKFYFQAKDKFITISHIEFDDTGIGSAAFEGYRRAVSVFVVLPTNYTEATATNIWVTTAPLKFPDGAIITKNEINLIDNDVTDSLIWTIRTANTGDTAILETQDGSVGAKSSGADPARRSVSYDIDLADADTLDKATVDNEKYDYQVSLWLNSGHQLYSVKYYYID